MSNLTRWSPFRELATMQSAFDRMFDENSRNFMTEGEWNANMLALDIDETDNHYTVTTSLPGVASDNINIRVDSGVLTIDAEIPERMVERDGEHALLRERRYGRFSRSIRLPQTVNIQDAEADFDNGVLTLTLPKAAEAQPKAIPVRTASKS